jgi:hypothetical protein
LIVRPKLLIIAALLLFCIGQRSVVALAAAETDKVAFVDVQLNIDGKMYEGLQNRIEFSIARVGEKILLSQPVAVLAANKATVKTAIFNVFSKVLIGFKLESVDLILGEHTKIVMNIKPIPPFITNVRFDIQPQDLNPELVRLTREVALKAEDEVNRIFVGLPVASISWSEGIFNTVVNYLLERDFPGFDSRFSIKEGAVTELNLILIPEKPVVSSVTVNYSATNIPAGVVKARSNGYQEQFDVLKGIPVEFLVHYQSRLEKYLNDSLTDYAELKRLGLAVQLGITPGVNTQVKLKVDSQYLRVRLEDRFFVDNDQNFNNLQAYLGYRVTDVELYTRHFWGESPNPSGPWKAGLGIPIGNNFSGGLEFEFEHDYRQAWLHYDFERGDYLDLKLGMDNSPNEATVGIYLTPHANLEFVNYQHTFGLQLMIHL